MLLGRTRLPDRPSFADGYSLADKVAQARADNAARDAAWWELSQSAYHDEQINNLTTSRREVDRAVYDHRNGIIHELTGVQLENPYDVADDAAPRPDGGYYPADVYSGRTSLADRLAGWQAQVASIRERFPDHGSRLKFGDIADARRAITNAADRRHEQATKGATDLSWYSRLGAELAGRGLATLRDPVQVGSLLIGGAEVKGVTVAGRIGMTMLQEAIVNAGVEAVVQTAAQKWRAENGLDAGFSQGLEQVGLAALFGGGIGGFARGLFEGLKALGKAGDAGMRGAAERLATAEPREGDTATLADGLGIDLSDLEKRMGAISEEQTGLDRASFGTPPDGVTAEELPDLLSAALTHVDDTDLPAPEGAIAVPERRPDVNRVVSEDLPAPEGAIEVQGRPARFERFDPSTLETDAAAYQYKEGGDAAGVTDRLADVRQWDATASGKVFVHERGGTRYIADGHQRLGLARRLQAEGEKDIRLDGYLFREKDGWTVEDVRALAAKKNMQEGSGSAMDAARILRDRPDLLDAGLPISGPMMKKALALSKLADDAWGLVVNEIAKEHHGVAVGRLVTDPSKHRAVLAELAKAGPETDRLTDLYTREILAADFAREEQTDMFGSAAVTRSLMPERVKVLDEAMKLLRRDKRLFAALTQNADLIEAAGNVLDASGNRDIATTAETVLGLIDRLARSRGLVSDFLTQAAERFAGGSTAAKEARAFVQAVQDELAAGGVRGLLEERPRPVLEPPVTVEPATPEAGELAELARVEAGTVNGFLDTRGGGRRFHGSPAAIAQLDEAHYSTLNYYGQGVYTTDAFDIASGYAGRGRSETPHYYQVAEKKPQQIFDMEAPIPEWLVGDLDGWPDGDVDLLEAALSESPQNTRELFDEIRAYSGSYQVSADEVQEIFDSFRARLEDQGFTAMRHVGGLRTNNPAHDVVIYFDPDSLALEPVDAADFRSPEGGDGSRPGEEPGGPSDQEGGEPSRTGNIAPEEAQEKSLWDVMPDGVDADGQTRFTDFEREAEKAGLLDDTADLIKACKD